MPETILIEIRDDIKDMKKTNEKIQTDIEKSTLHSPHNNIKRSIWI